MSEQKALVIPSSSSPYTLISKPIPVPGPRQVLVRLEGVALNPLEWLLTVHTQILDAIGYPAYTGSDGAGVIEEVGAEVKEFKKGDRVLFQGSVAPDYSTYQQYALALVETVVKLPSTISTLEAASIPLALITSAFAFCLPDPAVPSTSEAVGGLEIPFFLNGKAGAGLKPFWEEGAKGIKAGEPIVILGGSSSVGQLGIQIAAHYGFSPIITTSSTKHTEYLNSLGATHVLDRDASIDAIKEILGGATINYIYVTVNGAVTQAHVDLLAPGGIAISAIHFPPEIKFTDGKKSTMTNGAVHIYKDFGFGLMGALGGLLESGVIKPNRIEKIPRGLAGITDGLAKLQNNQVSGVKVVVDPTETPL
ncbi:hypothetical protein AAF712_003353 [Marasmius tenuissimus]|uniref:Enoyl reductase (ER) domain-containing protein n=1 Tax=Marasmius tenuissimus TaxID=585030 RepID=A0ABR3A840_9AGAR